MKFLPILILCLFSFNSFSNEDHYKHMEKKIDNMSFDEAKKMKLEMLDEKSAMIEQARKCVTASVDKSSLRGCMKEMREMKEEMKEEMRGKMKK